MRTTLTLSNEAFLAARAKADHENVSLGRAVSDLILQSISEERAQAATIPGDGVFRSNGGSYTSHEVEEAIDDE